MDIKSKKIVIDYTDNNTPIKLINNGNIKEKEDYIFEGTKNTTIIKDPLDFDIRIATKELQKYFNVFQ